MLSDEWLSRYGLLENFNASVTHTGTRTRTRTGTGTWTTGVTAIALSLRAVELKITPDVPNNKSGLTQMLMMGKSICQKWVNEVQQVYCHVGRHENNDTE